MELCAQAKETTVISRMEKLIRKVVERSMNGECP